jgi:AcrR family transcriptional regulator
MTTKKRDKVKTRQKILDTAKKIFAEKGFDGARVDEIAKQADVNKSLIYYYFDSKKEILEVLMQNFFAQSINRKEKHLKSVQKNVGKDNIFESLTDSVVDLLQGDKEILKIIIIEELKSEKEHWPLFQLFDQGLMDSFELFADSGIEFKQKDKLMQAVFYFGLIPSIFFILLREEWSDYYESNIEEDTEQFIEIMKKTYIDFLKNELIK